MARKAASATRWLKLLGLLLGALAAPAWSAEGAVDFDARIIRMVLPQEPPQLDSSKATDQVSTRVLGHVMEALTRFDAQGRLVPGVAERWEIRADGATFWLREDARWSDGSPVLARDFVFSWRNAVDPKTASEYAFILQGIENAEAISQGEAPVDSLGVSAPEPRRLEVRFSRAIAYFDKLVAFATFYPLKEDFYRARDGRYGADAEDMLFNGPFVIERWDHGARLEMAKNPHYWDRDNIYLNRIEFPYITADTNAALNLFKDNRIILAALDSETMENALDQRWRIERFNDGSAWYIEFNHREGRLTQNWNLRRALALSFNTYEFINPTGIGTRFISIGSSFPTSRRIRTPPSICSRMAASSSPASIRKPWRMPSISAGALSASTTAPRGISSSIIAKGDSRRTGIYGAPWPSVLIPTSSSIG